MTGNKEKTVFNVFLFRHAVYESNSTALQGSQEIY